VERGDILTIHATGRTEYVVIQLMIMMEALTLTGSPTISAGRIPDQSTTSGPWVRVTFDQLAGIHKGRFSTTQSAVEQSLLLTADIFCPHPSTVAPASLDVLADIAIASEIADALQFLSLDYLDYTIPAAPVTVADSFVYCSRPPEVQRIPDSDGFTRRRVKAVIGWYARYDDHFA